MPGTVEAEAPPRLNGEGAVVSPIPLCEEDIRAAIGALAYQIYQSRMETGKPGNSESDWAEACDLIIHAENSPTQPIPRRPSAAERTRARFEKRRAEDEAKKKRVTEVKLFFKSREVSFFPLRGMALMGVAQHSGCAASTISVLTGEHPLLVKRKLQREGLEDEKMVEELRKAGYEVTLLTDELMAPSEAFMMSPIISKHVVLVNGRATADKNTWMLIWGNTVIHNFEKAKFNRYTFLNRPPISRYLLWHPTWMNDEMVFDQISKTNMDELRRVPAENITLEHRANLYHDTGLYMQLHGSLPSEDESDDDAVE
jgi:hypothetical protein